jgi:hypothetical protein
MNSPSNSRSGASFVWLVAVVGATTTSLSRADDRIVFSRDIRPILSDACSQCHGPDEQKRKADLRLDTKEGAFADHDGAKAFVPGKPDASEALKRMTTADASKRMPPGKTGKKLTDAQIALVRKWVEQGADWSEHWAFTPPVRSKLPAVRDSAWVRTPIDAFVLARLERAKLTPAPEADRATLLRRLSLDLIGLPPSIAEVDAFLADQNPDAYEKQVERLLRSPHYGERWGRQWLDAARYADSDGYEKDKPRRAWAYRDWVIQALNADLPYDRFLVDQLAGDLLPDATQDEIVATGYLRNSMVNEEGGIDPEQFRMEAMYDRMDAVGKGILGLTIQCAQCHSHKFDPLTQEEYYRMFAFLNNCHEANVAVYSPTELQKRADLFRRIAEIEAGLKHRDPDWPDRMAAWEEKVRGDQPEWVVVRPAVEDNTDGGQKYLVQEDGSFLCQGYAPTKHRVRMTVKAPLASVTAFRLELLNDAELPLGGPGRSVKGTCALTEFEVEAAPADAPEKRTKIKLVKASADVNPPETVIDAIFDDKSGKRRVIVPVDFAIDGKDETAWGVDIGPGRRNQPRKAVFHAEAPVAFPAGAILTFSLKQNHGGWNSDDNQSYNLGRFRLAVTAAKDAVADPLPAQVRTILAVPAEKRTVAQVNTVFGYWRTTVAAWKPENDKIETLWREYPEGSTQLVLQGRERVRPTHLLNRGDFLQPGKAVGPGVPAFLHPLPADAPLNRLTFARWLTDRQSPTTARSLVNRVWQSYFGIGLIATSEDLGSQGERPVDPELLDWLAVEFMERGWSPKTLHRLIVTSSVYRQSSQVTPELSARDPDNRLLARGPRFRVDAEVVRDVALAASGLLNPSVGGPSVYPPAPSFLFQPPVSYGPKFWAKEPGKEQYRRAMYTFAYRSVPYPALQAFDAPNGDFACVRRARSNTPLQALTMLNEPIFLDCARALALRTVREGGGTDAERLTYSFRRCLARTPTPAEATALLGLLNRQTKRFSEPTAKPRELAFGDPDHPPTLPAGVSAADLAAWTAVSRVLLNLDETITKE